LIEGAGVQGFNSDNSAEWISNALSLSDFFAVQEPVVGTEEPRSAVLRMRHFSGQDLEG
jgi:hypothetical protein